MNLISVVRPVGEGFSPDEWVMPVVIYPRSAIGAGAEGNYLDGEVLSGQITVTTAGNAVQGTATPSATRVGVKAHPANAGPVWVGNDGADDVTSSNGFPLSPGEGVSLPGNLNLWYFDADNNGDKIAWVILE